MKRLTILLFALVLFGCEGTTGPRGPEGPPGPAAPIGQVFEVEADFNQSNDYAQIFSFPGSIEVYESDVVMVYLLWEVDSETGNDVWQPLPASVFFSGGEMQYAFDHTLADVQLFLTGDVDLDTVGDGYTQDQIFRVAIMPAEEVQSNNIDMHDMYAVMEATQQTKVERILLK